MAVIAFQTKIDNFMMLAQSKFSMKEHHHFELMHVAVIAFQTKLHNFMMLAQSKFSMKEHHHFELLTIDYDMLDILSVPYSSPIVISGKWRVSVTQKKTYS